MAPSDKDLPDYTDKISLELHNIFCCAAREIAVAVFNQKVNEFPIGNAQSEACQSNAISLGSGSRRSGRGSG